MIGQAGIGKSSFLTRFPGVQHSPATHTGDELKPACYTLETLNAAFDKVTLEIECCDIAIDTCLHDTDLLVNNRILPATATHSAQFINTSRFNVIILCFGMSDPISFEIVKCKWAVDLKKNKKQKHAFVLLGLKTKTNVAKLADTGALFGDSPAEIKQSRLRATIKKLSPKSRQRSPLDKTKRSLSANSLSSTSKIHKPTNGNNVNFYDDDDDQFSNDFFTQDDAAVTSAYKRLSISHYKKFAKLISSSSQNFIQHQSSLPSLCNNNDPATVDLNTYDKLLQCIVKSGEALTATAHTKTNNVVKLTRSITAPLTRPIHMLANRAKHRKIDENCKENVNNELIVEMTVVDGEQVANITNSNEQKQHKNRLVKSESAPLGLKDKLSRFAVNVGTYIVTCGTQRSRKLKHMKNLSELDEDNVIIEDETTGGEEEEDSSGAGKAMATGKGKRKLFKKLTGGKNKSFTLLSSQNSLYSVENSIFDE
jgi:GTPase SAR1 family protein